MFFTGCKKDPSEINLLIISFEIISVLKSIWLLLMGTRYRDKIAVKIEVRNAKYTKGFSIAKGERPAASRMTNSLSELILLIIKIVAANAAMGNMIATT
tara:strand:+ start:449 stop:745 length:297 start_codon:yes stop_codon:yes gene_type:complete